MLRRIGNMPEDDWRRTFNLGVGMIFVIPHEAPNAAMRCWEPGESRGSSAKWSPQRRGKARVEYV